jgi:hypothetical protein
MGFAGIAPEAVNGRLAMIGILGAAGAEFTGQVVISHLLPMSK